MQSKTLIQKIGTALIGLTALVGCDAINPPQHIQATYGGRVGQYNVIVADCNREEGASLKRRRISATGIDDAVRPYMIIGEDVGNDDNYKYPFPTVDIVEVYQAPNDFASSPSATKDGLGGVHPYEAGKQIYDAIDFLHSAEQQVVPFEKMFWSKDKSKDK